MDNNDQISIADTGITEEKKYSLDLFIQEYKPEPITKTRFMRHLCTPFKTTVQNMYRLIRNGKGEVSIDQNANKVTFSSKMAECSLDEITQIPD